MDETINSALELSRVLERDALEASIREKFDRLHIVALEFAGLQAKVGPEARNQVRLRAKKKLLDRQTEETVSFAQRNDRRDLIPVWCKVPDDFSSPQAECSRSAKQGNRKSDVETSSPNAPQQGEETEWKVDIKSSVQHKVEKGKKKRGKKARPNIPQETVCSPTHGASSLLTPTDDRTETCSVNTPKEEPVRKSNPVKFLKVATQELTQDEFVWYIKDRLAALGDRTPYVAKGWSTVDRKTKQTLPNVPIFETANMSSYKPPPEPESELDFEIEMYSRLRSLSSNGNFLEQLPASGLCRLRVSDTTLSSNGNLLEQLPAIPQDNIFPEQVQHNDEGAEVDDEKWLRDMYRRWCNLSISTEAPSSDPILDACISTEAHSSDPILDALPPIPTRYEARQLDEEFDKWYSEMAERVNNLDIRYSSRMVGGGVMPTVDEGKEMELPDVPELDFPQIPGFLPPDGVGAKSKEGKNIRKRMKKDLKKEAEKYKTIAKVKNEKAEELRLSADYCQRNPNALQFALEVSRRGSEQIERGKGVKYEREDTEEPKIEGKGGQTFVGAMMGAIMESVESANQQGTHQAEAEREYNYASATSFVQSNGSRGRSYVTGFEDPLPLYIRRSPQCERPRTPPSPTPQPPTPPKPACPTSDNFKMPYGHVLNSDAAWNMFK